MLIPRFSLKTLIGIVTLASLTSLVAAAAYRGEGWAGGIVVGAAFIPIFFLVHAAVFGVAWCFAAILPKAKTNLQPVATVDPTPNSPQG